MIKAFLSCYNSRFNLNFNNTEKKSAAQFFHSPGDIFMQDDASVHTVRIVQTILRKLRVTVMV